MVMFSQVCRILHGVWSIALKTFCTRPLSRKLPSSVVVVESLYFSGSACSAILYPRYVVCANIASMRWS